MKKSIKKIQLKKRSISALNTSAVKGGIMTLPITSFISLLCMSAIYQGEDYCVSIPQDTSQK
jgi:hypothetical protein